MTSAKAEAGPRPRRRIFIVDDHPITRYGLIQLLVREPDLVVCGEAPSAQAAIEMIGAACPDIVLVDITMPGKSGLEFLKEITTLHPGMNVLVMSMHDEIIYAERVLRAGGRGYIMKSEGGERLLEAIRQVLTGQIYVSKRMSASILSGLAQNGLSREHLGPAALSDREFEVFQLIGQGLSTREIGERLSLSVKTVGTHRVHIKEKLKVKTGPALVRQAVRWSAAQQLI